MNTFATMHDIGSQLIGFPALAPVTATAGGSGDNAAQTGITIDRFTYDQDFLSGVFYTQFENVIASGFFNNVTIVVKDSADNSQYDTYLTDVAHQFTASGHGLIATKVDLAGARRYFRIYVTADLTAGSVDNTKMSGVFVAGGFEQLQVTLPATPKSA